MTLTYYITFYQNHTKEQFAEMMQHVVLGADASYIEAKWVVFCRKPMAFLCELSGGSLQRLEAWLEKHYGPRVEDFISEET